MDAGSGTVRGGVRYFTLCLLCLLLSGQQMSCLRLILSPAIFGLTKDPLSFSQPMFCSPGTAAAVFPLGSLLDRLVYLAHRAVCRFRVYRHQTDHGSPSRQHIAVYQRGEGISSLRISPTWASGCYHRNSQNCCSGQPYEGRVPGTGERRVSSSCTPSVWDWRMWRLPAMAFGTPKASQLTYKIRDVVNTGTSRPYLITITRNRQAFMRAKDC